MTWSYRPALDGARTLAVYLVLLFHAEVTSVGNGFIGVDLFFVLSGFLVSTILYDELADRGRLDLLRFYDRRVRRLLPAALVLVVVVSVLGVLVLPPAARGPMAEDARAALLYFANLHFMAQSNDYFGSTIVDSSLFLHFWSLSIEEQFYLVFPVLLLVLHRGERRYRHLTVVGLAVLCLLSVVAQVLWARVDVNHAYYGTETRFYQLLAGVLLGRLLHLHRRSLRPPAAPWVPAVAVAAGAVGLLVLSGSWLELSPSNRGLAATAVSVALVGGLSGERPPWVARPFTLRPVVYLGKISYGTYLWHWPVVVLLSAALDPPGWQFALLVLIISTAAAAASYTVVETPIRKLRPTVSGRVAAVGLGLGCSVLAALMVVPPIMASEQPVALKGGTAIDGGRKNVSGPPPDLDYARLTGYREAPLRACLSDDLSPCQLVTGNGGPTLYVLGDSQAREMEPMLRRLAEEHDFNLTLLSLDACAWPGGISNLAAKVWVQDRCAQMLTGFWGDVIEKEDVDALLLVQQDRSIPLFDGTLSDSVSGEPVSDQRRLLVERTQETLRRADELGVPTFVIQSLWLPPDDVNPTECLSGARDVAQCRVPIVQSLSALDSAYVVEASTSEHIRTVDLNPLFCPAAPVCDAVLGGIPVWRDSRHISAMLMEAKREKIWRELRSSGLFDEAGGTGPGAAG